MDIIQVEKLIKKWKEGYEILITDGPYLDGFIKNIRISDGREDEEHLTGQWVYDSDVEEGKPLLSVYYSYVKIFEPIDFLTWESAKKPRI